MGDVTKCKECGSSELFWFAVNVNKSGIAEGRLRTHEVTCRFVLGCHNCSETLKTVDADRIAERMNSDRTELAALREELAATKVRENLLLNNPNNVFKKMCDLALKQRDDAKQRLTAAEQRNAALIASIVALPEDLKEMSGCENTAGVYACIDYISDWIAELSKPTESGASE